MPRLLHLLSSLEIGGKERAALRLARRAIADGFETRLLLFDAPYRDKGRDFDPGALPWHFVKRGPGLDLGFAKALADRCAKDRIDVLHAHNDSAHVYAALAGRLRFGPKPTVVTTLHTRPHHGGRMARFLMRNASVSPQVYAVSRQLADDVVADGWLRSCGVIVNGVDAVEFKPDGPKRDLRAEHDIPRSHAIFAHVARFDPIKRHQDLVAAMRELQTRDSPLTVICVGQGPLLADMRRQTADLGNVRFMDVIHDMATFLRSVDGVILCSEHEATPLALLEAMACAKPLVVTSVGGIPALLGEGNDESAGVLVQPFRPDLLATALARLASDARLRQTLGQHAYERSAKFGFEDEWTRYRSLYGGAASI